MGRKRVWIVDGHNVIFAIHELKELQLGGRGDEARRALADRLEVFALERQERVLLVFDGKALASGQGDVRGPHFEVVFARGGEGAADQHIIREASRSAGRGFSITVVTDDVHTLAKRLPRGVGHLSVHEFWLGQVEPMNDPREKPALRPLTELEVKMLEQMGVDAQKPPPIPPPARARPRASPAAPRDDSRERLRSKREKGRLRQERRLRRRR